MDILDFSRATHTGVHATKKRRLNWSMQCLDIDLTQGNADIYSVPFSPISNETTPINYIELVRAVVK